MKGRSSFRLVGGAGGWGKTLKKRSYSNDAGVKASTVLVDAATEAGETLSGSSTNTLGPAWTRPDDEPASAALGLIAPRNWYIGEDGITRIGQRTPGTLPSNMTRIAPVDHARGVVVLASESIATLLPGIVVDGITAVDVEHEISAKGGLRTTVWGALGTSTSRRVEALRALVGQLYPELRFRGVTEYRVVTQDGDRLNLQPARVSTGMPDLRRVPVRPGVAGASSEMTVGALVLVAFVDSSPARPVVLGLSDAADGAFVPISTTIDAKTSLSLGDGAVLGAARMTDPVIAGPFAGTITAGSLKTRIA